MANQAIRQLGELALRVNDFDKMVAFYRDVVGLEIYREFAEVVFFRVGEGAPGHPQVLALFDREPDVGQEHSTLDHFALVIELADYEAQERRLQDHGLTVSRREFPAFHWRSLFFHDPEGNTVEFVCHDPSV